MSESQQKGISIPLILTRHIYLLLGIYVYVVNTNTIYPDTLANIIQYQSKNKLILSTTVCILHTYIYIIY